MSVLRERLSTVTTKVQGERRSSSRPAVLPDAVRQAIRDELLKGLPRDWAKLAHQDPQYRTQLRRTIEELVDVHTRTLPSIPRSAAVEEIAQDVLGYGPIQQLLDDPEVTEVMVNAHDDIWVERAGVVERAEGVAFRDVEHARTILNKILAPIGREISEASPMVNARLPDGSRVNAVVHPIALSGFAMTIRKFTRQFSLEDLLAVGMLDERMAAFLQMAVRARASLVVSGGTGSGKTTLLNVLSSFIPPAERIVTIEDPAELQLRQPDVVRLEARPANMEGRGEVTIRHLVVNALRMRPDRIVVGEVRAAEALDMLQAMNTGHDGSLTTVHANSPKDAVNRLVTMTLMAGEGLTERAIHAQIAGAVNLIVQVSRLPGGVRRITEIDEVTGLGPGGVELRPVFAFRQRGVEDGQAVGAFVAFGYEPRLLGWLRRAGLGLPDGIFARDREADAWEEEVL